MGKQGAEATGHRGISLSIHHWALLMSSRSICIGCSSNTDALLTIIEIALGILAMVVKSIVRMAFEYRKEQLSLSRMVNAARQ